MSKARIQELSDKIVRAKYTYYNHKFPNGLKSLEVSDQVFDAWENELRALDANHSALKSIGTPIAQTEWKKAEHKIPLGSLDKVNKPEELSDWAKDKDNSEWFVIEKMDGLGIELVYEEGKLVDAITRGDGTIGESVLPNVSRMQGVINNLKEDFTGSLRGEIMMLNSTWQEHFKDKANPRNAASGVSKRLDGIGSEKLTVFLYQVVGETDFKTELDQLQWLKDHKCIVPNYWYFKSLNEVSLHWRDYQDKHRENLDYFIDGLVVRVNDLAKQLSFGEKDLRPKAAIAMKFDNEMKESVIKEIIWQVGNSGRVSPVVSIDPIHLAGAKVERASVYNYSYIKELELDVGAKVLVSRAGDVIPRIEQLIEGTGKTTTPPTNCPVCSSDLKEDGEHLMCLNMNCPSRVQGRIHNWVVELNLLEWGDAIIDRLVSSGKVETVADLYTLSISDLSSLERMGEKSANNCLNILNANKELPLETFLGGLSFHLIGASSIKLIMKSGCDTLAKFQQATVEDFEKVNGIGPTRAHSLFAGLKENKELINNLLENGIKIKEKIMGNLTNQSFCLTGKATRPRAEIVAMIEKAGGEVKNTVGKSLSYLVIADPNSTTSKAVAARKFGTKLITEEELIEMVGA